MDTPVHRAKSVQNHFDKNYIKYLYIPSYSPELNSIKDVLSKIKQLIKKQKARMPGDILNSLKKAFSIITGDDAKGYFEHATEV